MGGKNSCFSFKSTVLNSAEGMTLSEVLVVIAILGILILLAAFFIRPSFQIGKGRDGERKSDLQKLAIALEDYSTDHDCYPTETQGLNVLVPKYIPQSKILEDPLPGRSYIYDCPEGSEGNCSNGTAGCTKFAIFATLESGTGIWYGSGNYAVTSPNYSLAAPTGSSKSNYWGCKRGQCVQLSGPEECPNINYQLPNCGPNNPCVTPSNECH